ncbi:hypothetical protein D3C85_863690 [compost metagenome]
MVFVLQRHAEVDGAIERTRKVAFFSLQWNDDCLLFKGLEAACFLCVPSRVANADDFIGQCRAHGPTIFFGVVIPALELED